MGMWNQHGFRFLARAIPINVRQLDGLSSGAMKGRSHFFITKAR
jgi:hypothetical protein